MKKKRTVINAKELPFNKVEWGQTKELVGRFCEAQSDAVLFKITEYLPYFQHSAHTHPEQEEIIYVLSGRAITETEDGRLDLYPGMLCHVPAGIMHATYNPYEEPCRCVIVKSPPDEDRFKS